MNASGNNGFGEYGLPFKAFAFLFLAVCAGLMGCRREMADQRRLEPYAESDFFEDGAAMRPLPEGVVPWGEEASHLVRTGLDEDYLAGKIPFPVDRGFLERGRERYEIYCAVCHGLSGAGDGMIVQRGFPAPPSFHTERLRDAPPGHFVNVIAEGYGVMYSYAARVEPEDRWAITAYIRALQLSRNTALSDVPAEKREDLEAAE